MRDSLLQARHALERQFDAEIAARDHERVGELDDFGKPGDRLRFFDLGHDRRAPARDLFRFGDVFRPLDERERDPVDGLFQRSLEIDVILRSEGGERDDGIGKAYAFSIRYTAFDFDLGHGARARDLGDDEPHLAIVDQQPISRLQGRKNFGMRQVDARCIARFRIAIEHEGCAGCENGTPLRERAEAQFRAL